MLTITVNGAPFRAEMDSLRNTGDLVELVKASIDPASMITSVRINGRNLSDSEWQSPISAVGASIFEFTTGPRTSFILEKLGQAEAYLDQIAKRFKEASGNFHKASSSDGNQSFAQAVNDLLAFIGWYASCLSIEQSLADEFLPAYSDQMKQIHQTCEQLLQQQLHNAWWALGITLDKKLLPQLDGLKEFCRRVVTTAVAM